MDTIPTWFPSASISRTSRARICSLTRLLGFMGRHLHSFVSTTSQQASSVSRAKKNQPATSLFLAAGRKLRRRTHPEGDMLPAAGNPCSQPRRATMGEKREIGLLLRPSVGRFRGGIPTERRCRRPQSGGASPDPVRGVKVKTMPGGDGTAGIDRIYRIHRRSLAQDEGGFPHCPISSASRWSRAGRVRVIRTRIHSPNTTLPAARADNWKPCEISSCRG